MENKNEISKKRELFLPISILIAALLIGGAIVWSTGKRSEQAPNPTDTSNQENLEMLAEKVSPVTDADHIWGDKDAPVKIITFTDLECPFCREFHKTIEKTLTAFDGKVAVVYRHFPLSQIHPGAEKKAQGAECIAVLGGEEKFWQYVSKVFELSETETLSPTKLPDVASGLGIDKQKFSECLASGKYDERISANTQDGITAGGQGTPYTIVISPKGKKYPVPGAYPFDSTGPGVPSFKSIVDEALVN